MAMERLLRSPEAVDVLQFCDWRELGSMARVLRFERSPLRLLLDGSPEALARETEGVHTRRAYGRLKLHEVMGKAPGEVVEVVLRAHPSAAKQQDELGRLPIFYAATRNAPASVVQALIDAYPEAVRTSGLWNVYNQGTQVRPIGGRACFALSFLASQYGSSYAVVRTLQLAEIAQN